ncbi:class I SAM-dependent methyltransferase [Vibrio sp. SS-MA-C1-2]|uniref:class I SAM-dependent methyltransferase n=1 Tax=Vibrio sp. SS-MA-C1-2 TaxID=2908646 RepID=UPI0038FCC68F
MTNQYYNNNAKGFFDSTVNVNVTELYEQFLPHVPNNGTILDAGCGSGRDSKNFLNLGYQVTAFDASESLVKLASEYLGLTVSKSTFKTFSAKIASFDAIWACASLLHVPDKELPSVFLRLGKLLKPNGVFYCSFKYGEGDKLRNGRLFTDMNEQSLESIIFNSALKVKCTWVSSDARPERESEQWLNAILIKD